MKTYKEFLTELFDNPVKWKYVSSQSGKDLDVYTFNIGENEYFVHLEFITVIDELLVEFSIIDPIDKHRTTHLTKTGNEFKVFATVMDILRFYLKYTDLPIKTVSFSAYKPYEDDKQSRISLYKRMVKKYVSTKEWKITIQDENEYTEFFLTKII